MVDINGIGSFFNAVKINDTASVRAYVQGGNDINLRDDAGDNAFCFATTPSMVDELYGMGININEQDDFGNTPVMDAVSPKYEEINGIFYEVKREGVAEELANKGADLNIENDLGQTTASLLIDQGNKDLFQEFVNRENGIDINTLDDNQNTLLHYCFGYSNDAIKAMHKRDIADILIDEGLDVNAENDQGETPLFKAIDDENLDDIKFLYDKGADFNYENCMGGTPLSKALSVQNNEITKYLIENGAVAEKKQLNDLLNSAIDAKDIDSAKLFLDKGADADTRYEDQDKFNSHFKTILTKSFDNEELFDLLVDKGADVNAKDNYKETVLMDALKSNANEHILDTLIDNGAEVNAKGGHDGYTPLMYGVAFGANKESIQKLIDNGADVNATDYSGKTALMVCNDAETAKMLIENGAEIDATDKQGSTALMQVTSDAVKKVLIDAGSDVNAENDNKQSPLSFILSDNQTEELLKNGADPNHKDENALTPIFSAIYNRLPNSVQKLIDWGAEVNTADESGQTPLGAAAGIDEAKSTKNLIEAGADVNAQDENGDAPLHEAAEAVSFDNADALIDNDADKSIKNERGYTAEKEADIAGNFDIRDYIFGKQKDVTMKPDEFRQDLRSKALPKRSGLSAERQQKVNSDMLDHVTDGVSVLSEDIVNGADKATIDSMMTEVYDYDSLKLLIENGGDVNAERTDEYGNEYTPLTHALVCGVDSDKKRMVDLLIRCGADINHKDSNGKTPLMYAASSDNSAELVNLLLGKEMTIVDNNGNSIIADVNAKDNNGCSALMYANSVDTANILVDNGIDPKATDKNGNSPMRYASTVDMARFFKEKGNEITAGDIESALYISANREAVAEYMLEESNFDEQTYQQILDKAFECGYKYSEGVVEALLQKNPNLNLNGALNTAAWNGDPSMVKMLIENGATCTNDTLNSAISRIESYNQENKRDVIKQCLETPNIVVSGTTLLPELASLGWNDLLELAIQKGADINAGNPMMNAVDNAQTEAVRTLKRLGADINLADATGKTPLRHAVEANMNEMTRVLIELGADQSIADNQGVTPAAAAEQNGYNDIAETLKTAKAQSSWLSYENAENFFANGITSLTSRLSSIL